MKILIRTARRKRLKKTTFDELKHQLNLGRYKVQKSKTTSSGYISKYVILPKLWLDTHNIKVGDEVEYVMEKNGSLSVRKVGEGT